MVTCRSIFLYLLLTGFAGQARGVSAEDAAPDDTLSVPNRNNLSVYLDHSDLDFFIQELDYISFVRDPADADVQIVYSSQSTASGGAEYVVRFLGHRRFEGTGDTLTYFCPVDATEDDYRNKLLHTVQLGLVRYLAKRGDGEKLTISYTEATESQQPIDEWDNWVYKIYFYDYFQGQSSYRTHNLYSYISANRITEDWKILTGVNGSLDESTYHLDTGTIVSKTESRGASVTVVKSLGSHWSGRIEGLLSSSSFRNLDLASTVAPGVEYNIFPYSESSSRQLRLQYEIRFKHFDYHEETIFFRTEETRFAEALTTALEFVQPWGTSSFYLEFSHYFHDPEKLRLYANMNLEYRLFEGLSLELWGSSSMIRDQLSLPRSGATEEEILLQRRELQTNYEYYGSIGVSYTFGSIYNNVVNPRFGD